MMGLMRLKPVHMWKQSAGSNGDIADEGVRHVQNITCVGRSRAAELLDRKIPVKLPSSPLLEPFGLVNIGVISAMHLESM